MRYISELREGGRIQDVYLCKHKQSAVTKNGKNYENVILQDRTGVIDAKIWDPNSDSAKPIPVSISLRTISRSRRRTARSCTASSWGTFGR